MLKKLFNLYSFPLLISLTTAIVILGLSVARSPLEITLIFVGAFIGTFVLELDYFLYAYFLEPQKEFSKSLMAFIKDKDFKSLLDHIKYHRNEISEKTLNSALFQVVLGALMIFVVSSNTSIIIKAITLSTFSNSAYRMMEDHYLRGTNEWFWSFKKKPTRNSFYVYCLGLLLVFIYSLSLFR